MAAHLIGGFAKTDPSDSVSHFMHEVLYWVPLPPHIYFWISSLVWRCFLGELPMYLRELCHLVSPSGGHHPLHAAAHSDLTIPFACTATMQLRAFSVFGPVTTRNGLPWEVHCLPWVLPSPFYRFLKTAFFCWAWLSSASE